jgi:ABC-2 type transport system ATP-binding protein
VSESVIVTTGLTKRYGRVVAVDAVDVDVRDGEIYGFLGPNGSGKTTTVRMLLGLVFATRGEIEVLGRPIPRAAGHVLPQVGALVEGPAFTPYLSGRAALARIDAAGPGGGRRDRRARIEEALERVGLGGIDRRPVKAYSLGMRQRLGIAATLLRRPRLLVLDEPTNGLDPQGMREMRDLLVSLNAHGTTVFLSSHLLAEVESMCHRVGIVNAGKLVAQDEVARLRAPTGRILVRTPDVDAAVSALGDGVVARDGDEVVVTGDDPAELNAHLVAHGVAVRELVVERRTLEDAFLTLTEPGSDRVGAA